MPGRERGEAGQFVETVPLDSVLDVFDRVRGPVITTSDVAEQLNCTTEAARQKLTRLYDRGKVNRRKTGRTVVYWRTEGEGEIEESSSERQQEEPAVDQVEPSNTPRTSQSKSARAVDRDDTPRAFADVQFPEGRDPDECEAAVLAARDYLREHGPATMREIVTAVMPEHPVGYDVPELEPGDRYRGAWWRRVVKPGLKELPDVQAPSRGASDWHYHPDPETEAEPNG